MGKTLIIAEKPSVGQDYARALGGGFQKHEGYLESEDQIVSWAIGHLVELAEPEDYDESLKRWSIKTLPVLPETFKLRPDARGRKQLDILKRLMKREDVELLLAARVRPQLERLGEHGQGLDRPLPEALVVVLRLGELDQVADRPRHDPVLRLEVAVVLLEAAAEGAGVVLPDRRLLRDDQRLAHSGGRVAPRETGP